ncbi:hypothetical protein ACQP3F_29430, partial [Escherichia coli]
RICERTKNGNDVCVTMWKALRLAYGSTLELQLQWGVFYRISILYFNRKIYFPSGNISTSG